MSKIGIFSDTHIGTKGFQKEKFIKGLRSVDRILLLGDIINGITKKDKRHSNTDIIMSVDDEIIEARSILRPFRNRIDYYCIGNHEDTVLTILDIDAPKLICKELGIEYGYTSIKEYNGTSIAITHGTGSGITYGGNVTMLERFAKNYDANIFCTGHTHRLFDITMSKHPNIIYKVVSTGSFTSKAEYAEKMFLPPAICGYYVFDTRNNKLTKVEI